MLLGIGDYILTAIAFFIILGAIILIHEGGHFYFATRAGILCREYAFGMGPLIWKKKKGETLYSIRAFPVGGFCAICGEEIENDPLKELKTIRLGFNEGGLIDKIYLPTDGKNPVSLFDDKPLYRLISYDLYDEKDTGKLYMTVAPVDCSDDSKNQTFDVDPKACFIYGTNGCNNENVSKEKRLKNCVGEYQIGPHNRTLDSKTFGQRIMVMFGGPMMNFVLAIFVFFISFCITGVSNTNSNIVAEYDEGAEQMSPLYKAGVRGGDKITELKSGELQVEVKTWNDISKFMDEYSVLQTKNDVTVTYLDSSDNTKAVTITPMVYIYSISMYQDLSSDEVKIAPLVEKSKAYQAGLREGDIIEKIIVNDKETVINSWIEVYDVFASVIDGETDVTLRVKRDGTSLDEDIVVRPYSKKLFDKTQNVGIVDLKLGVSCTQTRNLFKIVRSTFVQMWSSIRQLFNTLGMLIFSKSVGIRDLSGPVGIFTMTKTALGGGIGNLFYWCGFLSVNVGFMNLLPIPALDGGRILFLVIEKIRRKPVSRKVQDIAINVTYYALLALILYVTINDILRIVR